MEEEKKYWVAFSVFPGIGPVRFRLLTDYFGSARKAWGATIHELESIGLGQTLIASFCAFRERFPIDGYLDQLHQERISVLTLRDTHYPDLLRQIADAPFLLYVKGKRGTEPINVRRTIGVVGTRKMTGYGREVTRQIVGGLVDHGYTIVSGMALGVDAVAHETALAQGGSTIAVLGCGVNVIAPSGNARLYHDIVASGRGAVVSEMPLGLYPDKGLFVARNRIISGLSRGIVITEGAVNSGTMITARFAADQGRDVFAVPGHIDGPMSQGPMQLIKNGAQLVASARDILDSL
jgi:DNA processing protein